MSVAIGQQTLVTESYSIRPTIEHADEAARKKNGRLARLIYEIECIDTVGFNRRVYPREIFLEAAKRLQEEADIGQVWGRLDHPDSFLEKPEVTVADAATRLVSVETPDDRPKSCRVTLDVVDNRFGEQLISLFKVGGVPALSQRGFAIFEEATRAEKDRYGVPDSQHLVIARLLRLETYDSVAKPGFTQPGPKVTEGKHMDVQTLKAQHPKTAEQLVSEGRELAKKDLQKDIDAAVEAAKPGIVEAAIKPLKDDLDKVRKELKEATEALDAVKGTLAKAGLVKEQISDAEARKRVDALEGEKTDLTRKVSEATAKVTELQAKVEAYEKAGRIAEARAKVAERYASAKHKDMILKAVEGVDSVDKALSLAAAKEAEIATIAGSLGSKTEPHEADPNGGSRGEPAKVAEGRKERIAIGASVL